MDYWQWRIKKYWNIQHMILVSKKFNFQEVLIQLHPDNSNLGGKLKEFLSNQEYEFLGVENKGLEIREK